MSSYPSDFRYLLEFFGADLPVGILCSVMTDGRFPLYYISDYLLDITGYSRDEFRQLYGDDMSPLLISSDVTSTAEKLAAIVNDGRETTVSFHIIRRDSATLWLNDRIRRITLPDGRYLLAGIVTDVTDIKQRQQDAEKRASDLARQRDEISRAADLDMLTGVYNREATMRNIDQFLKGEGRFSKHALFMIDIDNFKTVNDTFGHRTGDETLVNLSRALRHCFRDTDIVGRVGGDEFFAFMKYSHRKSAVTRKAEEVIEALEYICASGSEQVAVSGSVGVCVYEGDDTPLGVLYARSDAALYAAKSNGKNCYSVFSQGDTPMPEREPAAVPERSSISMRKLIDNIGNGFLVIHKSRRSFTPSYVNDSLLSLLGDMNEDEFMRIYGEDIFSGVHPDDKEPLRYACEQAISLHEPIRMTYRLIDAHSVYHWVSIVGNIIENPDSSFDIYSVYFDAEDEVRRVSELDLQFRDALSYRRLTKVNTVACFHANITKNLCDGGESDNYDILNMQRSGLLDGFFEAVYSRFESEDELRRFRMVFSREGLMALYQKGIISPTFEHRFALSNGHSIWIRTMAEMLENPATHDVEALIYAFDINREMNVKLIVDKLLTSDYNFLGSIDVASAVFTLYGGSSKFGFETLSEGTCDYDRMRSSVLERAVRSDNAAECMELSVLDNVMRQLSHCDPYTFMFPTRSTSERESYGQWKFSYLDESQTVIMLTSTDITDAVSVERDPLTGLYNRHGFYSHVRSALDASSDMQFRIIRFDIDNFKMFNDAFGTESGDKLLRDIGRVMYNQHLSGNSVYARLDADHFVVFAPDEGYSAEELHSLMQKWFDDYPVNFTLLTHMGVYRIDEPDIDVSIMCDRALLALKSKKENYYERIAYYDDSIRTKLVREQSLISEMAHALEAGQFVVYFQPQINYSDGSLIGAEALVRWDHPERGLLSPAAFVPVFERNGLISALDEYVWRKCCDYIRLWHSQSDKYIPISVSVNISRVDIYNPQLVDTLDSMICDSGLPHELLKLEITESAYMQNPEQLIAIVKSLRNRGFTVEMDDFGSGYSSLNTLKDVPVDILKLDVRFLSGGEDDARGGSILSSVIRMAHWLKIPVIAEGVETKTHADYLKSLGCVFMQGYYFGKPMPVDEFEQLLSRSNVTSSNRYSGIDLNGVAAFWDPSAQNALLFNSFVGGAAIMEYNGTNLEILRANDMFYSQIGITREKYLPLQQHTLDRFDTEDRMRVVKMLERTMRTGAEAECEIQSTALPGTNDKIWSHVRARLLARNGDDCLFYTAIENITERKRMEEALRMSRQTMQLAISRMGRIICNYDVKTATLSLPAEYAKMRGLPMFIKGIPFVMNYPVAEDRNGLCAFFFDIIHGNAEGSFTSRTSNADGSYRWEKASYVTVYSDSGVAVSAVITVEDVTAVADQEAERARSRLILENGGIAFIDYDVAADTLHCQTKFVDAGVLHYDVPDYLSCLKTDRALVHPDYREDVAILIKELVSSGPRSGTFEYRTRLWDSVYRWSRFDYASVADGSGRIYRIVGQVIDIQKQKEKEGLINSIDSALKTKSMDGVIYSVAVVERIFMLLYQSESSASTVDSVLSFLGAQYGLCHAEVYESVPERDAYARTFEWHASGASCISTVRFMGDSDGLGAFVCPDTSMLDELRASALGNAAIRSILQCAILDNGVFEGYISYDVCTQSHHWTDEETGTLLLVSRILGTFLLKLRKSEQAAFSSDFRAALDNNSEYIYIIDPSTYSIVYNNKRIRSSTGTSYEGKHCYREFINRDSPCNDCPAKAYMSKGTIAPVVIERADGMLLLSQASPIHWMGRDLMMISCTGLDDLKTLKAVSNRADSLQLMCDHMSSAAVLYEKRADGFMMSSANRAAKELLAYCSEAKSGRIPCCGSTAALDSVMRTALENSSVQTVQLCISRSDGSIDQLTVHLTPASENAVFVLFE